LRTTNVIADSINKSDLNGQWWSWISKAANAVGNFANQHASTLISIGVGIGALESPQGQSVQGQPDSGVS
jgi:hypothetical protein